MQILLWVRIGYDNVSCLQNQTCFASDHMTNGVVYIRMLGNKLLKWVLKFIHGQLISMFFPKIAPFSL